MKNYTVITENDESEWDDITGERYHFPKRYLKYLEPGTKIIYYKGSMKNPFYNNRRLTKDPHYFGIAEIEKVYPDSKSLKNDYFADLKNYYGFPAPVYIRIKEEYIEKIPITRQINYWRDGVRPIDIETYNKIMKISGLS